MRTRIKFCGLTRAADVDTAVALGVDAVGLVLWPRSPRALDAEQARALRRRLPSFVQAVGLFVNDAPERVAQLAAEVGLDVLQLHGDESPGDCLRAARLAARAQGLGADASGGRGIAAADAASGRDGSEVPLPADGQAPALPWWRAVRMRARADLLESAVRFGGAECLLLDAFTPGYGGGGHPFDWDWIAPDAQPALPAARLILAGGLTPERVGEAIRRCAPFAVDVSSGIQGASPREKDAGRMERFVAAVLAADAQRSQTRSGNP